MKNAIRPKMAISILLVFSCLFLLGCGNSTAGEIDESLTDDVQVVPMESPAEDSTQAIPSQAGEEPMEIPEMEIVELSEEDIAVIMSTVQNTVAEETDLWYFAEITGQEQLTLLMQSYAPANGQAPEGMTPPEGSAMEFPEGEIPSQNGEAPEWTGEMPEWNGEVPEWGGEAPEGFTPEGGEFTAPGGMQGRSPGGMLPSLAIVISNTEGTSVPVEDILQNAESAASELGYRILSVTISENTGILPALSEGFSHNAILFVIAA